MPVQGWRSQWWFFLAGISPASPALPTTVAARWGSDSLYLILTWVTPCPVQLAVKAVSSPSPGISNCWERTFIAGLNQSSLAEIICIVCLLRYERFGAEELVLQSGGLLCPQPGCGAGIMLEEGGGDCKRVPCVTCGYVFCRCLKGGYI